MPTTVVSNQAITRYFQIKRSLKIVQNANKASDHPVLPWGSVWFQLRERALAARFGRTNEAVDDGSVGFDGGNVTKDRKNNWHAGRVDETCSGAGRRRQTPCDRRAPVPWCLQPRISPANQRYDSNHNHKNYTTASMTATKANRIPGAQQSLLCSLAYLAHHQNIWNHRSRSNSSLHQASSRSRTTWNQLLGECTIYDRLRADEERPLSVVELASVCGCWDATRCGWR